LTDELAKRHNAGLSGVFVKFPHGGPMIKRLIVGSAVAAMTLMLPTQAMAQATAGDREVSIAGNLFQSVGGDGGGFSTGNAMFGFGYFLSDRLQVVVQPTLTISSFSSPGFDSRGFPTGDDERSTTVSLSLGAKVVRYLGEASARMKPYYGGNLIIQDFEAVGDTTFAAGVVGFKNYLTEKAALDINGSYGFNISSPGSGGLLQATVGIAYIF
jgi:hypothetical protein